MAWEYDELIDGETVTRELEAADLNDATAQALAAAVGDVLVVRLGTPTPEVDAGVAKLVALGLTEAEARALAGGSA